MKHTHVGISLLVLMLAFGGLLRVWNLGAQPYWMDEGFTVAAVQAIEDTGTHILGSGFSYTCPLYCVPTSHIADVLGRTSFSYRILAAVAGTLFIGVIFLVARRLFDTRIALLSTFFASFSYFQIAWSRQARWYSLFELFFWVSVFCFHHALYEKKRRYVYIVLTVLTGALATLTHELGYLLPVIFAAWTVIDAALTERISKKVFLGICGAGVAAAAVGAYVLDPKLSLSLPFYLGFYVRSYWLLIGLAIVAAFHPSNRYRTQMSFIGLILFAYLLPLSFLSDIVNYRYLFHVTPVLFMLAAIGTFGIMSDLPKRWQKSLVIPVVIAIFIASGQGVLIPKSQYFLESDNPESLILRGRQSFIFVPQPDWNAAYGYVKSVEAPGDAIVSTQSQFNDIFLGIPGYWIRYSYNGKDFMKETADGREFYVGAKIIGSLQDFQTLAANSHGYVLIDVYAKNKIPQDLRLYMEQHLESIFHEKTNAYSEVWVYRF